MGKKKKMMIGVAVVVVGILIGSVLAWDVLTTSNSNKTSSAWPMEVRLIVSKPPKLNETVNVTFIVKIDQEVEENRNYSFSFADYGAEIVLINGYSDGFEWIEGKRNFAANEILKNATDLDEGFAEINEPYFRFGNYSGGRFDHILEFGGKVKANKIGNWTIVAYVNYTGGDFPDITVVAPWGENAPWVEYIGVVTIHVSEDSSYIVEEFARNPMGYTYFYRTTETYEGLSTPPS